MAERRSTTGLKTFFSAPGTNCAPAVSNNGVRYKYGWGQIDRVPTAGTQAGR